MGQQYRKPTAEDFEFPEDATPAEIDAFLKRQSPIKADASVAPKAPTWADRLGLNEPTVSQMTGFARGAGAGVVDLTQGAIGNITQQLRSKQQGDQALLESAANRPMPSDPAVPVVETPPNFPGTVGSALPAVAEMAIGGGPVVKSALKAIPTRAKAGEKFQSVMGAAKAIPIDVGDVGDAALRIQQLAERGGSMPLAVRKLLNRITDPEKAPMAYEEARDFASNISRLSANEFGRLTPAVAREVANLRVVLNKANAMAAKQAGKADEYASAMKEYSNAMRIRGMVNSAADGAKKAVLPASMVGAGYWLTKQLEKALGGG